MTFSIVTLYIVGFFCSLYFLLRALPKSYLPMARPIALFSFTLSLHFILSLADVLSTSLRVSQFISDYNSVLISLTIPLSIWMWYEFHLDKRVNVGWFLVLAFDPLIVFIIATHELVLSLALQLDASVLVAPYQRFGIYGPIRLVYLIGMASFLIAFSCWTVHKSKKITQLSVFTFGISLAIPFIASLAYAFEFIPFRLGGFSIIGMLMWGTYHYRILDVFPIAKNQIISRINSGIMVFNSHKELVYVNAFFRRLLSLPSESIKGVVPLNQPAKNLIQMFSWESLESQKEIVILNSSGEFSPNDDLMDGQRFFYIELEKIENKTNFSIGYILMLQEVTEQVLLRKDVLNKNVQLENINQNRSNFFAGISHEFKTPLTLSCGYVESILNGQYNVPLESLTTPLNLIYENNQRLLSFVNQLLDFSQLDGEKLPIKLVQLNLNQHINSILAQFESTFQQQNIQYAFQSSLQKTPILFDLQSFEKVVLNLVSNAIKSMSDGGFLNIEVIDHNEKYWRMNIQDTGFGIDESIQENLFEPFVYREHHAQNWQKGSGVGLSLVKQILEIHGGKISIKHTGSNGTCFSVDLKKGIHEHEIHDSEFFDESKIHDHLIDDLTFHQDELTTAHVGTSHTDTLLKNTEEKPIVLIVDDNADIRALVSSQIDENYLIINAVNGEQGLGLAKQHIPDVVITDIMMPVMDGLQMCTALKQEVSTSHIPIIMLTAKSGEESLLESLQSGADDFILKPYKSKELGFRVQNLLKRQSSLRNFYSAQFQRSADVFSLDPNQEKESLFIETIKDYINNNISKQKINTSELASLVHMSERSFNRKIKAILGMPPKQLVLSSRMQYAENQLINTKQTIAAISFAVGFSDASYFSRAFKSFYDITPTEYRNNLSNTNHNY